MLLLGIDTVEIGRMEQSLKRPRFLARVFGEEEQKELMSRGLPAQSAAACFAAKEAFGKALGVGISGFSLREVQLLHLPNGCPYLFFTGKAAELAAAAGCEFAVSCTHTSRYASSVVAGLRASEGEKAK